MTTFRKLNNNEAFDHITGKRMHDGGNSLVRAWIGRADSVSKMHRRAQRAESDVALMSRQSHHWRNAYERMTQIVCDAWDALPVHIREEIESPMLPSGAILPQPRDLVRGVSMLADETRTCDVCGATGELDSRCGRCIR